MVSIRELRSFVVPTWPQVIISLVVSLVYLGLSFRDAITSLVSGATNIQTAYFHASYQEQITIISQFGFTRELTIGIFWAGVGIIGYFVIITLANLVIALRNEVVIDSMYANSGTLRSHLKAPMVRLSLILIFGVVLWATLGALIPGVWLPMFGNFLLIGATPLYVAQALGAILGMGLNVYVLILLFLGIKNLDQFM